MPLKEQFLATRGGMRGTAAAATTTTKTIIINHIDFFLSFNLDSGLCLFDPELFFVGKLREAYC